MDPSQCCEMYFVRRRGLALVLVFFQEKELRLVVTLLET